MYFLKVINSLPGKLSKYKVFFFSVQGAYKKNCLYKRNKLLFSSAFKALRTKKPFVQKEHALIFFSVQGTYEKKPFVQK